MPQRILLEAGLSESDYALALVALRTACDRLPNESALVIAAYIARLIRSGIRDPDELVEETCTKLRAGHQQG